jgi:hypothetical protein
MLNSATRQHQLRAPKPSRPQSRSTMSPDHYAMLAGRLTVRDRWITRMVAEHRTLTSTQIAAIAFTSRRAANLRLLQLYQWRILDRFQPHVAVGSAPMFYVLDVAGAHTLAYEDGLDPQALHFHAERSVGIGHSIRLAHLHGVNTVFTGLIAHARQHPDTAVTAWWPETRCVRAFGDLVRPDGYGKWREADREIEWFLEHDTGSYALTKVTTKLADYATLATTTNITTPVLFHFTSAAREAHARAALAAAHHDLPRPEQVPIATTASLAEEDTDMSGRVWLPLHHAQGGRLRLIDLASQWPRVLTSPATPPAEPVARDAAARLAPPAPMPPWTNAHAWAVGRGSG